MIPALKTQIDAAVQSTTQLTHSFWNGTLPPFREREDSVKPRAVIRLDVWVAQRSKIPCLWADRTRDAIDTWTYASELYANASRGVVYLSGRASAGLKIFSIPWCVHLGRAAQLFDLACRNTMLWSTIQQLPRSTKSMCICLMWTNRNCSGHHRRRQISRLCS
jgi:hypothetical protein